MADLSEMEIFDGDSRIIFSGEFITYERKLVFKNIMDREFTINFETDPQNENPRLNYRGNDEKVNITAVNFNSPLGTSTKQKLNFLQTDTDNGTIVYSFALHAKSISDESKFLLVTFSIFSNG